MVKSSAVSTALAVALLLSVSHSNIKTHAFQISQPAALSPLSVASTVNKRSTQFATSTFSAHNNQRNNKMILDLSISRGDNKNMNDDNKSSSSRGMSKQLFRTVSQKSRHTLQKIRRSFTILLASLAFFLSSTHMMHTPPAHAAASTAAAIATKQSIVQRLNPFHTKSADEMIDNYVRTKLFADDEYDPVESAYREAYSDDAGTSSTTSSTGAYPTLLAETAGTALGTTKSVSSLISKTPTVGTTATGKNDGITALLIKASDVLQSKLKVSASISYYILAASGIVGITTVPGIIGVLYQGIQRAQIDKSEMKMYGKISE